jgi:hypothetical protein
MIESGTQYAIGAYILALVLILGYAAITTARYVAAARRAGAAKAQK